MSLTRRLQMSLALLMLLAVVMNLFFQVRSTRSFLESQLQSHAQDTATSLAISLVPALTQNDDIWVERTIAAIFDRGYYQRIIWRDVHGKEKRFWESRPNPIAVPDWFARILPIASPSATALLNAGWSQKGEILVVSHIGYAQLALWQSFVDLVLGSVIAVIGLISLVMLTVKNSLEPLHRMAQAAHSFVHKKTPMQLPEKIVAELTPLANALAQMSQQILTQFNSQAEQIAELYQKLHKDDVTQLPNRLSLLDALAQKEAAGMSFQLLAIRLLNLPQINSEWGYQRTNTLLQQWSNQLIAIPHYHWFRLSGSEWVAICDTTPSPTLPATLNPLIVCGCYLRFYGNESTHKVLSLLDQSLNEVQQRQLSFMVAPESTILSTEQWRTRLQDAMSSNAFNFAPATVKDRNNQIIAKEWLARLPMPQLPPVHAGQLFAQAIKLGMNEALELSLLQKLRQNPSTDEHWHINISAEALCNDTVVQQLIKWRQTQHISVEISEQSMKNHTELNAVLVKLRTANIGFGIDGVSMNTGLLGALPKLRPDYLKLGLAFSESGPDSALLQAITRLCQSLDIDVYVQVTHNSMKRHGLTRPCKGYCMRRSNFSRSKIRGKIEARTKNVDGTSAPICAIL